jgi:hypothetical protein
MGESKNTHIEYKHNVKTANFLRSCNERIFGQTHIIKAADFLQSYIESVFG